MKIEAKRNFDFELEDDDEDFLSQVAAVEARVLASKRRRVSDHTTDPPKKPVTDFADKVSPNVDAEGLYIAALKGNSNVLSQISGGGANSRVKAVSAGEKGFVSTNQSEGGGSCFKCGKLGHWARDCDASRGEGFFGASGNDASIAEKACPCSLGVCVVLTANTEKNRGRKFYKCPVRQEQGGCGFFEWCDNASGNSVMTYASQNHASASGASFSDLQCPCGAGSCLILSAKTGENVGQQFYRCPSYQATCGFFQWCKGPNIATKNRMTAYDVYGNAKDASKSFSLRTGSSTDTGKGLRTSSSCYKCGNEGHWARDCSLSSSNPPAELGRSQSSSMTCYKCGKPGHWVRDCSNC